MTIEDQYAEAIGRGLTEADMLRNIDNRAKSLGERFTDIIRGNRLWSLEETTREAEDAKALHMWLVDKMLRRS